MSLLHGVLILLRSFLVDLAEDVRSLRIRLRRGHWHIEDKISDSLLDVLCASGKHDTVREVFI